MWRVFVFSFCYSWKSTSSFTPLTQTLLSSVSKFSFRPRTNNLQAAALTQEDLERFVEQKEREDAVASCPLFRDLPLGDCARLVAVMRTVQNLPLDEPFLREGDPGDSMYLVASGSFECYSGETVYKVCEKGDYFGELALLYTTPRAASVRPISSSDDEDDATNKLWEIRAADFDIAAKSRRAIMEEIAKHSGYDNAIDQMEKVQTLKTIPWFKGIGPDDLEKITNEMKLVKVKEGKDIVKQGEEGNAMYFVAKGTFECYNDKTGEVVGVCQENDYFGELALLFSQPRAVSVRAASKGTSTLWELSGERFLASIQGEEEFETVVDAISRRYLM